MIFKEFIRSGFFRSVSETIIRLLHLDWPSCLTVSPEEPTRLAVGLVKSTVGTHLLVQGLVVLKQGLEGLEDLHLAGDPGGRLGLPLDHRHPQGALVTRHQTLQVLQQQLMGEEEEESGGKEEQGQRRREEKHRGQEEKSGGKEEKGQRRREVKSGGQEEEASGGQGEEKGGGKEEKGQRRRRVEDSRRRRVEERRRKDRGGERRRVEERRRKDRGGG